MAKLPSSLVLFLTLILVPDCIAKSQPRIWFLSVRDIYRISVNESGGLSTARKIPTLYSLIRVKMFGKESGDESPTFSLEGVATNRRVCMGKKGFATTEKIKWRVRRNKSRRMDPFIPENCIFKKLIFNSTTIFKFGIAIYNSLQTMSDSTTVGRFIAFDHFGKNRRYKTPLNNVTNFGVNIQFHSPNFTMMDEYINATTFSSCNKKKPVPGGKTFNREMQECIRSRKNATALNKLEKSNILYKTIQKCHKKVCTSRKSHRQVKVRRRIAPTLNGRSGRQLSGRGHFLRNLTSIE